MSENQNIDSREVVLAAIEASSGISRAELADLTGLSKSTVSKIVRELVAQSLVDEAPAPSAGGRPVQTLTPTSHYGPVWSVEVGTAHARIATFDRPGHVSALDEIAIDIAAGPQETLGVILSALEALSPSGTTPSALGIALPGPVDTENYCVVSAARMPDWNSRDLRDYVDGIPLVVENDAHAGALGEVTSRPPSEQPTQSIFIKAGTGIGGALMLGTSLYHGHLGLAGDFTHNALSDVGETLCTCGRRGCLETIASGAGIIRSLREHGVEAHDIRGLLALVNQGHPMACALVRQAGTSIGITLAPLVTFLNPQEVIIGGALSSLDGFNAGLRGELYARCLPVTTKNLIINASSTGANAAIYGMADLCHRTASANE